MNEITKKYITDSLEKNREKMVIATQTIESLQFQKDEYLKQIENSKSEIDMGYDVFSAKPIKNQFYREQIRNFQEQVDRIDLELEVEYRKLSEAETLKKEMEACLEDLKLSEKEYEENKSKLVEEKVSELVIQREEVESLIYKCENSKAFFKVDKDRGAMELDEIIKCLRKILEA